MRESVKQIISSDCTAEEPPWARRCGKKLSLSFRGNEGGSSDGGERMMESWKVWTLILTNPLEAPPLPFISFCPVLILTLFPAWVCADAASSPSVTVPGERTRSLMWSEIRLVCACAPLSLLKGERWNKLTEVSRHTWLIFKGNDLNAVDKLGIFHGFWKGC